MSSGQATNPTQDPAQLSSEDRAAQELFDRLRSATLGEFDILGELGRGGMATVFLAFEISLDRKVAIKVMLPSMVHRSGMVERFKREARTAAALSHPNIIPVYSVREVDGLLFCVIKLVQGTPLDSIMKELGQLPVAMVQGILAQVGGALGYAHRRGVVHRDIKPGNILIDDEGWAVVTDFGIAKVTDNEGLTQTGMAVGTPAYMSPEQASADVITGASDQYSLGIVAYEMLVGKTPFTGTSIMALMYSHFHDEPPSLRLMRPDVPDQLHDAVMRMLRKAPGERWASMEEAVAGAGARPLDPDDPNRSQLISLAKTGLTHRIVAQAATPRSPIPVGRRGAGAVASRAARNPMALVAGGAGMLAAGFLIAKLVGGGTPAVSDPAAQPPSPQSGQVQSERPEQPERLEPREPDERPEPKAPDEPPKGGGSSAPNVAAPPRTGADQGTAGRSASSSPITTAAPTGERKDSTVQRPESSVTPPVQKAESTVAPAVLPLPPATSAAPANQPTSPIISRTPDPAVEVTAVIQSYARALASSDMTLARRLYAGMPDNQRRGLEALWSDGGTMILTWSITDIVVDGNVATARVRGTNAVTTRRGQTSTVPVALRARLERRGTEWRLVSLVN